MGTRRFPWMAVLVTWAVTAVALTVLFRGVIANGAFNDTDDYMRLQQVRDLIAGQSWFDIAQHRVNPPEGLAMHWSRLVDLPLLLFIVPLTPLVGQPTAEMIALVGAPLLNLLALLIAVAAATRILHPQARFAVSCACLFAIVTPSIFAQIHPGRIDHHGWQIALAGAAFASLLDRRAVRSGVLAGTLTALFLAISLEGAPFAVAALGAVAVLWLTGLEHGQRLTWFATSLASVSMVANLLLAPSSRWTEMQCDAVMTGHLAAIVIGGVALVFAVRLTDGRRWFVRMAALVAAGATGLITLYALAPQCVGSPFGTMDPLVNRIWFQSVKEGLPFWQQQPLVAVATLAFPVIGLIGALVALWRSDDGCSRRNWWLVVLMGFATLLTGAFVMRAGGIAQVVAIPGAIILVDAIVRWAAQLGTMIGRVMAHAIGIVMVSPIGAVAVTALALPDVQAPAVPIKCDVTCAMDKLGERPAVMIMNQIDLGPSLIARTHHSAYVASYHRLQRPMADTIRLFMGSESDARRFIETRKLRYILIAPDSGETSVYLKHAPKGFAAQLVAGKVPYWLHRVELGGSKSLLLFEVIRP